VALTLTDMRQVVDLLYPLLTVRALIADHHAKWGVNDAKCDSLLVVLDQEITTIFTQLLSVP
jgi:hypothetical protein